MLPKHVPKGKGRRRCYVLRSSRTCAPSRALLAAKPGPGIKRPGRRGGGERLERPRLGPPRTSPIVMTIMTARSPCSVVLARMSPNLYTTAISLNPDAPLILPLYPGACGPPPGHHLTPCLRKTLYTAATPATVFVAAALGAKYAAYARHASDASL